MVHAVSQPQPAAEVADDPGRVLLFAALGPAVALAVGAGVPFDSVRDQLLRQLARASLARHGAQVAGLVLGRTVRQLRNLRQLGGAPRGENYVERAEAILRAEGPLSLGELAARLPRYYAFDAAQVAVDALVAQGRVVAERPPARRAGVTRYRVVAAPPPGAAPEDAEARADALAALMRAVTPAVQADATLTATGRLRPAALATLLADAEAWLAQRQRDTPDGVEVSLYVGAAPVG